jgi:hypothetical protein
MNIIWKSKELGGVAFMFQPPVALWAETLDAFIAGNLAKLE